MSSHVRQHKSPYFYVRKGAGFVLLENHVETGTRYKTEAEAKHAVLALNDAWRAKGVKKSNLRRRNPPRSGLGIPRDLVLPKDLTPYGITASDLQTYRDKMAAMLQDIMPSLPPESVLGGPAAPGRYSVVGEWVAAPAMKPSKAISLGFQIALPQAGPRAYVFINTLITAAEPSIHGRRAVPPMWGISVGPSFVDAPEVQAQFRRLPQKDFIRRGYNYVEALRDIDAIKAYLLAALGVQRRNPRRRNPAAEAEMILWARPAGKTNALYEQPIYTVGRTMEDVERVKKLAAKDGWHTFRVQRIDLSKPYNPQQEFAATVRGSRRRNPAPVVAYIQQYGAWYSANERQWASLVAAGVSGKVWNLRHLATPLKSRPTSRKSTAIPVIEPIDFVTPERWLEADEQVRRMQTVLARPRSRRNPAPTRAEIVERADISIENGMGSETMTALEDMLDGYDGDNIRAQFYVGWRDSDLQALLDELGTRNVRRRNPRRRSGH
jgi:hypothetical protein